MSNPKLNPSPRAEQISRTSSSAACTIQGGVGITRSTDSGPGRPGLSLLTLAASGGFSFTAVRLRVVMPRAARKPEVGACDTKCAD